MERCAWCGTDPVYCAYHDTEWGVPEHDGRALWEKLVLDGFQAGLAWITILRKRDAFRARFEGFEPSLISRWGEAEIAGALADAGIVRSRAKIEATVRGARLWEKIEAREGFSTYLWGFVDGAPVQNAWASMAEIPTETDISRALSRDLKARGFNFVGPVIVYAFMQAVGMVNDHVVTCHRHGPVRDLGTTG